MVCLIIELYFCLDLRFEPDPRLFDAVTVSAHDFLTRLFDRQAG